MKNVSEIKIGKDQKIFNVLAYVLVGLFAIVCLVPFYLIVVGSLTSESSIIKEGYSFFLTAKNFSTEAYKLALKNPQSILHAYGVTIFVTVIGTLLSIFMTTMTGYVLARPDFPWRNGISFFFFFTTLFSGGLVPWYLMCTQYLHFNNHIYSLIIPGLFSVWNMIIAKSFMKGIPFEIIEAAKIDGAGDFFIYVRIILPMAKPSIITVILFEFLAYWNEYIISMTMLTDPNGARTLPVGLLNLMKAQNAKAEYGQMYAGMVMVMIPTLILYMCVQKKLTQGMTLGGLKG